MTYPKQLTTQASLVLAPFLPQLKSLGEGESFVLEDTEENIQILRYYIYSWLHLNALKEVYVLRKEAPTRLRIQRKAIPAPKIISTERLTSGEEFVKEFLLEVESREEAVALVESAILRGDLSPDLLPEVMEEWRRINAL